jgi:hypothetical protein
MRIETGLVVALGVKERGIHKRMAHKPGVTAF